MWRLARWGRRLVWAALAVGLLGCLYVAVTFVHVWSTARTDQAGPADAIVVLGAAQYDGEPSPVLRARLDHAAALYEAGHAPLIVVTGGKQEGDRVTQALAGFNHLRGLGIPEESILLEVDGDSTYTELRATERILADRDLDRVLMVSEAYHSARLLAIADEVGLDGAVSPTDTDYGVGSLLRETAALSLGRIVGFRRLDSLS